MKENKKVLLALSGGVDSVASAILLKNKGYNLSAATMILAPNMEYEIDKIKEICNKLEIKHYIFDFRKEFNDIVIKDYLEQYSQIKTPNPCVKCNKHFKFGKFYEEAVKLGFDYIATGHYARIEYDDVLKEYNLKKAKNTRKDQSYFLYNIKKEYLEKILFPLGDYEQKEEIRDIVSKFDIELSEKKDSKEICFIEGNYADYLIKNLKEKPQKGNIVDKEGNVLGKHNGLIYYTTGQRKNINISYKYPLYVIDLNKEENEVVVGKKEEIFSKEFYISEVNYLINMDNNNEIRLKTRARYNVKEEMSTLYKEEDGLVKIVFDKPDQAITKGQSAVFYKDDIVVGGGIII